MIALSAIQYAHFVHRNINNGWYNKPHLLIEKPCLAISASNYLKMTSGGSKGARWRPPGGPKFFQFHAVLGKIWQNRMLAPPPRGVGALSSEKSWIRH